jgi:hypothetical protein
MMGGELLLLPSDAFGKTFPVTYLPRGATVSAYQWKRRPGPPDRDCRI